MNDQVHPAMRPFLNAIAPRHGKWSFDFEVFENTAHAIYFVYDASGFTVATCRRREDAERIVEDHNK